MPLSMHIIWSELLKTKRLGDDDWWQPKKLQAPGSAPTSPKGNSWYIDQQTKKIYFWHEAEQRWYVSAAFTPVDA